MTKPTAQAVSDYIGSQPAPAQRVLRKVRSAIRRAIPRAEETISYKIPAYKLEGQVIIYFAAWKEHYSIYPAGERLVKAFKKELTRFDLSKGTIRFPLDEPVPLTLITRIAKFRAKEVAARTKPTRGR